MKLKEKIKSFTNDLSKKEKIILIEGGMDIIVNAIRTLLDFNPPSNNSDSNYAYKDD